MKWIHAGSTPLRATGVGPDVVSCGLCLEGPSRTGGAYNPRAASAFVSPSWESAEIASVEAYVVGSRANTFTAHLHAGSAIRRYLE